MSLQNRCHVPIARLKSAQATVGNIPTHPILSTAIPCGGHVVFPNAPSNMVRHAHAMLLAACLAVSPYAFAEAPDPPQSAPASKPTSQPVAIDEDRPVNWKSLVPNIYHDQRAIWTFPAKLAHGEDWKPTVAFLAGLGALVALDPHDSPYFRNNPGICRIQSSIKRKQCDARHLPCPRLVLRFGMGAQGLIQHPHFTLSRRSCRRL